VSIDKAPCKVPIAKAGGLCHDFMLRHIQRKNNVFFYVGSTLCFSAQERCSILTKPAILLGVVINESLSYFCDVFFEIVELTNRCDKSSYSYYRISIGSVSQICTESCFLMII